MAFSTLATVLSVAGTAISGFAQYQAAQSNAAIQEFNAQVAETNAKREEQSAEVNAQEQDFKTRGLLGEQKAAQAASGIDIGVGSPKYTRIAARELGRKDALNIKQAGDINAASYRNQAASAHMQADADRAAGGFGLLSSFLSAGSTITKARATTRPASYYAPVPTPRPTVLL